jgi:hypothetical protein
MTMEHAKMTEFNNTIPQPKSEPGIVKGEALVNTLDPMFTPAYSVLLTDVMMLRL